MNWSDTVRITNLEVNGQRRGEEISLSDFRSSLLSHPTGMQEIVKDVTVDLTSNAAKYLASGIVLPAGAFVKYVGAIIRTLVVGGGTTVKVGLGPHGGTTNKWGFTGDLLLGTGIQSCFGTVISTQESIDVNGVTSAGTALGDTNLTAGSIRIVAIYDIPAVLV